jgi:ABC-type transport system involved in cytochrome c biogenesis ATPase subunit
MQDSVEVNPVSVKSDANISLPGDEKAANHGSENKKESLKVENTEHGRGVDPFDVDDADWSLEKALLAAIEQADQRGDAPIIPRISLTFKNVEAYGDDARNVVQADAGSLFADMFRFLFRPRRKRAEKEIIHGIDGFLDEGEMLLVSGGPGSGCTTFLKMLSGHREGYRRWGGHIRYSGIPLDDMLPRFRGSIIYNGEVDHHFSHLTIAQTLEFTARTKTPYRRVGGMSRKKYVQLAKDVLGAVFGLTHNFQTKVGNDFVRGLSGGEKRRLAVAEAVRFPHTLVHAVSELIIFAAGSSCIGHMLGQSNSRSRFININRVCASSSHPDDFYQKRVRMCAVPTRRFTCSNLRQSSSSPSRPSNLVW